jgi:hypothetical protein
LRPNATAATTFDISQWKSVELKLALDKNHDIKVAEIGHGEYAIATAGRDSYVFVKNFTQAYIPSKAYVVAVQYKSDADTKFNILCRNASGIRRVHGEVTKTQEWKWHFFDFTVEGKSRGPVEFLRFDMGGGATVQHFSLRNVLLVEANDKLRRMAAFGDAVDKISSFGIKVASAQPKIDSMETVHHQSKKNVSVVVSVYKYMDLDALTKSAQGEPSAKAPVPLGPPLVTGEGENPENHTVVRLLSPYQVAEVQFLAYPPEITGGVGLKTVKLPDGGAGFAAWPLSSNQTSEIRIFDRYGGLAGSFAVERKIKPPFIVGAAGPNMLAVAARRHNGASVPVRFYSLEGKLLHETAVRLKESGDNEYALLTNRAGTVVLENLTRKEAYTVSTGGAKFAFAFGQVKGDGRLFDTAFNDRAYTAGGPEKIVSTLYAVGDGGAVRAMDAGRMENIFWYALLSNHGGEPAAWTPIPEGKYVKRFLYNFLGDAMSWSPLVSTGNIENKSYAEWTAGIDFENSAYQASKVRKSLAQYDEGLPATWPLIFTHRWTSKGKLRTLIARKDPATGLPLYLALSRKNEPDGGGYFNQRLFDYGSQNFEQEALTHLYNDCQREFFRHLAPHYRKNPEMTIALEPDHENEVVSSPDSAGDYNPKNVEGFCHYLLALYGNLANINRILGTSFSNDFFDAPRGAFRGAWDSYDPKNPYFQAWFEYNRTVIYRRVGMGYLQTLLAGFPPELIKCHQIPDSYALGNVGISEGSIRITPIDWFFTMGAGYGISRYGTDYQLPHNIYEGAHSSGFDGMLIGEYASLTNSLDRAYGQLEYLRKNGVASAHVMWWPTFMMKGVNEPQNEALRKLAAESDTPKPGYAGGIGEVRAYQGPAGTFDIAELGVEAENTGLIKSLRQDGSFEGTVYVTPFHAHVGITTLVSKASFQIPTRTTQLCPVPGLRAGSVIEITFTNAAKPAADIELHIVHNGIDLADDTVTLKSLIPGQHVRVVYKEPLILDGVTLGIVSHRAPVTIKDLRVYHHQDLAVSLTKGIMEGTRHKGGVTFDVLPAE